MTNLRQSIRNHSRGFVSEAKLYKAAKRQVARERLADKKKHKKMVSKARHARSPIGIGEDQTDPKNQLINLSYADGQYEEGFEILCLGLSPWSAKKKTY